MEGVGIGRRVELREDHHTMPVGGIEKKGASQDSASEECCSSAREEGWNGRLAAVRVLLEGIAASLYVFDLAMGAM